MDLEAVKLYLRVDGEEEDGLIQDLVDAAFEYIKSTTGKTKGADGVPIEDKPLVQTAVKQLVCHWYDNRGTQYLSGNFKNVTDIAFSTKMIVEYITSSGDYIE